MLIFSVTVFGTAAQLWKLINKHLDSTFSQKQKGELHHKSFMIILYLFGMMKHHPTQQYVVGHQILILENAHPYLTMFEQADRQLQ